ncbi:MAG: hypothetical protein ABEJ30_01895 [Halorientalis sp.]
MLRVVVAAVLATALLSTAFAALDVVEHDRSNARVAASVERLRAAAADLDARAAPVPPGTEGARRVVRVWLPSRTLGTAPIRYLAVGSGQGQERGPAVRWRVAGSSERTRHVPGVRVVGRGTGPRGTLVLERPGTHRLALTLVEQSGRGVVLVRRLG